MAKEKNSSDPTTKKTTAKKSPAKAAAPKKSAANKPVNSEPAPAAFASVKTAKPVPAELYEEIRKRAYELYTERGGHHGSHEADWHRAETEVRAKYK